MTDRHDVETTRLGQLLEAYGADPGRWPGAERSEARARLGAAGDLATLQAEAATLDRLLDQAPLPLPSPTLMADILAAASPQPWQRWAHLLWPFGPIWKPATAFALVAMLGLAAGGVLPSQSSLDGSHAAYEVEGLMFGTTASLWSL